MRKMRLKHKAFKKGLIYQETSPSPSFFKGPLVDGGLVTLSRYPIIKSQFQEFPYGVLSDNLSLKGVLYTKIDIQGNILHLFNTHYQASYVGSEDNTRATVMTRIDQMKCQRKFISQILDRERASESEMVLLVGDFNVDALHDGYSSEVLRYFPDIQNLLQMNLNDLNSVYDEYKALFTILSNNNTENLIDIVKVSHDGQSQITYGDSKIHSDGSKKPKEVVLTDRKDQNSNQCLDYIIHLTQNIQLAEQSKLKIDYQSVKIEKFQIEDQIFTQLSDHYGISCNIIFKSG